VGLRELSRGRGLEMWETDKRDGEGREGYKKLNGLKETVKEE
jgi:hypothetical protein